MTLDRSEQALLQLGIALRAAGYEFTTVTPATHSRVNARPGREWATDLRGVFGWSRPFRAGVMPADMVSLMEAAEVVAPHGEGWRSLARLSCLAGDLFWHSAYPTVAADAVFFGPDTYRFAAAIGGLGGRVARAVDVCCGAGPGGVVLARAYPEAEVVAADINAVAVRLARVNAAMAGLSNLAAVQSDLLGGVEGMFDLIVANPPYLVDPAGRAYRHGGGTLGAGLSLTILDAALGRLAPGGRLVLYTGAAVVNGVDPFRMAVASRFRGETAFWTYREVDPDVFGEELMAGAYDEADRIAAVVLTVELPEVPHA